MGLAARRLGGSEFRDIRKRLRQATAEAARNPHKQLGARTAAALHSLLNPKHPSEVPSPLPVACALPPGLLHEPTPPSTTSEPCPKHARCKTQARCESNPLPLQICTGSQVNLSASVLQAVAAVAQLAVTTTHSEACCRIAASTGACCSELLYLIKSSYRSAANAELLRNALTVLGSLARHESTAQAVAAAKDCVAVLAQQLQAFRDQEVRPMGKYHLYE